MRDYALTRSLALGDIAGGSFIVRLLRNWRARRGIAKLDGYDDFLLRDIGVSRADVRWAAGLPLTVNAALALEERTSRNRRFPRPD